MSFCRRSDSLRLCGIALLACVCAQTASAQSHYSLEYLQWDASWFGGGSFAAGKSEFLTPVLNGNNARAVGMHFGSGYQVGARIHENLSDFWGADLEYSFANQPLSFTNLSPDIQSLALSQSVNNFSYGFSFLPLRPHSRFRPYAGAQAGASLFYIHKDSKQDALDRGLKLHDDWKFLFNWGGGFKYLLTDGVGFAFNVKDQMTGIPSYGLPSTARIINGRFQPGLAKTGLMQIWQLNVGITYQWDEFDP